MGISSFWSKDGISRSRLRTRFAARKDTDKADLARFDNQAGKSGGDMVSISEGKVEQAARVGRGFLATCVTGLLVGGLALALGASAPVSGPLLAAATVLNVAGTVGTVASSLVKKSRQNFADKVSKAHGDARRDQYYEIVNSHKEASPSAPKTLAAF